MPCVSSLPLRHRPSISRVSRIQGGAATVQCSRRNPWEVYSTMIMKSAASLQGGVGASRVIVTGAGPRMIVVQAVVAVGPVSSMLAEGRQAVPAGRLDHVSDGRPSLRRQRHSRLRMAAASQPRELRVPAKFSTARRRSSAGGGKSNRVVLSICPAPGAPGQGAGDAELVSRGTDGVGSCHGLGSLCPLSRDIALTALTSDAGPASGRRPADGAPPPRAAIPD